MVLCALTIRIQPPGIGCSYSLSWGQVPHCLDGFLPEYLVEVKDTTLGLEYMYG